MMTVKIDEETALSVLMERLNSYWNPSPEVASLFEKMYESYVYGGVFEGGEFDVKVIVDNDWVNYTTTKDASDPEWSELLKDYKENGGCGDISCGESGFSYIEAVDNEDEPTLMLVRY